MISAIFDGAAHITVAGCLGAFFFKQTVVDRTSKVIKEAENITAGLVISEFCISVAVLVLASNKTAQMLLSKDAQPPKHNLAELNALLICKMTDFSTASESILSNPITNEPRSTSPSASISSNQIANDFFCTSPSTTCSTLCSPLLLTSPVQNTKRLSIDSDTTLVDPDDDFVTDFSDTDLQENTFPEDDGDCSNGNLFVGTKALTHDDSSGPSQRTPQLQLIILKDRHRSTSALTDFSLLPDASTQTTMTLFLGSIPPQTVTLWLKPPHTKWHQNFRPGRNKHESRSTCFAAVCDSIERTHAKQLQDNTMIDDLEQLHDELLADQAALVDGWAAAMAQLGLTSKLSPDPGNSVAIIQDSHLHAQHYSQGPLRPNLEDAQRPPSLSPTTWSFTAREVEGHSWPRTNYLFAPPSRLLRCQMSPTTESRRNHNITASFLSLTTWSRRPPPAARTCIYLKSILFSSPSCNYLDLFLFSMYFSYRHVLGRQRTACDLRTHLPFIDMYSIDVGLVVSFVTCRHDFPFFHSMESFFPSTIYLIDNVSSFS